MGRAERDEGHSQEREAMRRTKAWSIQPGLERYRDLPRGTGAGLGVAH